MVMDLPEDVRAVNLSGGVSCKIDTGDFGWHGTAIDTSDRCESNAGLCEVVMGEDIAAARGLRRNLDPPSMNGVTGISCNNATRNTPSLAENCAEKGEDDKTTI